MTVTSDRYTQAAKMVNALILAEHDIDSASFVAPSGWFTELRDSRGVILTNGDTILGLPLVESAEYSDVQLMTT